MFLTSTKSLTLASNQLYNKMHWNQVKDAVWSSLENELEILDAWSKAVSSKYIEISDAI